MLICPASGNLTPRLLVRPLEFRDADREFDAPLTHCHRLRLHEAKGMGIALLGTRACHGIECFVQPLPLAGDLGFSSPQFR
jgi:hypothetical protein